MTLGKLFTNMCLSHQQYNLVSEFEMHYQIHWLGTVGVNPSLSLAAYSTGWGNLDNYAQLTDTNHWNNEYTHILTEHIDKLIKVNIYK